MGLGHSLPLPAKVGISLLIALTLFVSIARPLSRPSDSLSRSLGRRLTRLNLQSEPSIDHETPLEEPAAREADLVVLPLAGTLLLLLKSRQTAHRPIALRRMKIPPRTTASSLISD